MKESKEPNQSCVESKEDEEPWLLFLPNAVRQLKPKLKLLKQ